MKHGAQPDENPALATVRAIYAAVARSDLPAALDLLAPDIEVHQDDALSMGGARHGFGVTPTHMFSDDDEVIVLARITGAAGTLDQSMMENWRVRDGKVTECRPFYFDPATAAMATYKEGM